MKKLYHTALCYWAFGISIFMMGASLCLHIEGAMLTDHNIVIGFIGVLVTFVVLTNYAQGVKIEKKIEDHDRIIKENKD